MLYTLCSVCIIHIYFLLYIILVDDNSHEWWVPEARRRQRCCELKRNTLTVVRLNYLAYSYVHGWLHFLFHTIFFFLFFFTLAYLEPFWQEVFWYRRLHNSFLWQQRSLIQWTISGGNWSQLCWQLMYR